MEACSDSFEDGSDQSFQFPCTICDKKNRHARGIRYCLDCSSYLCKMCLQQHNDFPPMATHKMLDEEEMVNADQHQMMRPTEKCPEHHGNLVDMFCEGHDAVCCSACALLKHKSCNLVYIPKAVTRFIKTTEYADVVSESKRVVEDLKDQVKTCEDNKSKLADECDDTMNSIKKWTDDSRETIDKLEASTIKLVKSRFFSKETDIDTRIGSLNDAIGMTEGHLERVEHTKDRNECRKFTNTKMLKQASRNGKEILAQMSVGAGRECLNFQLDAGTVDALSRVKALGHFFVDDKVEKVASPCTGNFRSMIKIDMSGSHQSKCRISGSCILQNGDIILADLANEQLVRLGIKYKIKDVLGLPGCPFDVCATRANEMAVSLVANRKILMVSVGSTMKITKSFDVGEECLGLVCIHDRLYVCCWPDAFKELKLKEDKSSRFEVETSVEDSSSDEATPTDDLSSYEETTTDDSSSDEETSTAEAKPGAPGDPSKMDKPHASRDDSSSGNKDSKDEANADGPTDPDDEDSEDGANTDAPNDPYDEDSEDGAKADAPNNPHKSEGTDDNSIGFIKVFSDTGTLLSTLKNDVTGKAICSRPSYITFDKESSQLFISSFRYGVSVTTLDGRVASHLTTSGSSGMAVIRNNHIFVGEIDGIMQIGPTGKKIGTAMTAPVDTNAVKKSSMEPVTVCYDKTHAKLIVSYNSGYKIAVFDID